MKILQVNVVYKKGSTGKIVYDIHNELKKHDINSIVCYGRGTEVNETNVYKTSNEILAKFNALKSRITGLQYDGSFISTNILIGIIRREKPDIVHLHCLNGYFVNIYRLFSYLKKNKVKTVLTLHAEFMHTGSCGHAYDCERWKTGCGNCPRLKSATKSYYLDRTDNAWIKMKNAFDGFNHLIVVCVSKWISDRAKLSPIMKDKEFKVIHNGIETSSIFFNKNKEAEQLRAKLNIKDDEYVILHVTPNFKDEIKGGIYFIELANKMKNKRCKFIIIGFNGNIDSLPNNVIPIGRTENQDELASYYSLANLFIITSKQDNYPTVCLEAISCGTPVVGFDVGGVKETIPNGFGTVVIPYDINELKLAALYWLDKKSSIKADYLNSIRIYNSKERMCSEYIDIYELLCGGKKVDKSKNKD